MKIHSLFTLICLIFLTGCEHSQSFKGDSGIKANSELPYTAGIKVQVFRDALGGSAGDELIARSIKEIKRTADDVTSKHEGTSVQVERLRFSMIVRIKVVSEDPAKAVDIADHIAEEYIKSIPDGTARIVEPAALYTSPISKSS